MAGQNIEPISGSHATGSTVLIGGAEGIFSDRCLMNSALFNTESGHAIAIRRTQPCGGKNRRNRQLSVRRKSTDVALRSDRRATVCRSRFCPALFESSRTRDNLSRLMDNALSAPDFLLQMAQC
jgi:hypothetical protein